MSFDIIVLESISDRAIPPAVAMQDLNAPSKDIFKGQAQNRCARTKA